jgi:hypothetical protein
MRTTVVSSAILLFTMTFAAAPASAEPQRAGTRGRTVHVAPQAHVAGPRAVVRGPVVVAPRVIAPRVVVAPYRFYRPYYSFRPHFNLGFGLFVGYPVAFPYYYGPYPYGAAYPYPYPAPYPYAAPPPAASPQAGNGVSVQPSATNSAGVSFEITPADADVYVDGGYIGHVSDFGPQSEPLALAPGRHRIEIRRAGYQTLSFDADAVAGEVIPYQGTMQPGR